MNKREISEIKKQLTPSSCCISRICGCYVDGEKQKITQFKEAFLSLPEEDIFKFLDIFRKSMTGKIEKNLFNMDFPLECEEADGTQDFLLRLRNSQLKDDDLLDQFFDSVIEAYDYAGNYLVLLIYSTYDIPGKSTDNMTMVDASDEVYSYITCAICPMNLTKPGLAYDTKEQRIQNRVRDWVVEMPMHGFLFPTFNDRSADIHSVLYYAKKSSDLQQNFISSIFACPSPIAADDQKAMFEMILEDSVGERLDFSKAKMIHDNLMERVVESHERIETCTLGKQQLKDILEECNVEESILESFDAVYDSVAGENVSLNGENLVNQNKFEVKTGSVVIHAKPEDATMIETKIVDGMRCIVIAVEDKIEVNGVCTSF